MRKVTELFIPYDPEISLVGHIPKEVKDRKKKNHIYTKMFLITFVMAKHRKQSEYPFNRKWFNKLWPMNTIEYYYTVRLKNVKNSEKWKISMN